MSEESKKTEKIETETKPGELSEQDLEQVAGGATTAAPQPTHKSTQSMNKFAGS